MFAVLSLGIATFILFAFEFIRFRVPAINRWFFSSCKSLLREEEASCLTGASYMLIASFIVFLVFQRDIAVVALSFLAVGDPLAVAAAGVMNLMQI